MTPGCWNFHSTRPPCGKTMCRASTHRAVCPYQTWGRIFFSIPYQVILLQAFWAHLILTMGLYGTHSCHPLLPMWELRLGKITCQGHIVNKYQSLDLSQELSDSTLCNWGFYSPAHTSRVRDRPGLFLKEPRWGLPCPTIYAAQGWALSETGVEMGMAPPYLQSDRGKLRQGRALGNSVTFAPSTRPHWIQSLLLLAWA